MRGELGCAGWVWDRGCGGVDLGRWRLLGDDLALIPPAIAMRRAMAIVSPGCARSLTAEVPTGSLVAAFRQRLSDGPRLRIETLHAGLKIYRPEDTVVQWCAPSHLREVDVFFMDEVSQIPDDVWVKVVAALQELPHKPLVSVSGDFQQLSPIGGGGVVERAVREFPRIELETVYRTTDQQHLEFLNHIREQQPSKGAVESYFSGRVLPRDLEKAVSRGLQLQRERDAPFVWLCVTNAGATKVCEAALRVLGENPSNDLQHKWSGEPRLRTGRIVLKKGVVLRLTRNLDKAHGFVNGGLGEVEEVLDEEQGVAVVKLIGGSGRILLHPVVTREQE